MTQIEKTVPYDMGHRSGAQMLRDTLAKTQEHKALDVAMQKDMRELLQQAQLSGVGIKEQLHISRLLGYVDELSYLLGAMHALGMRFTINEGAHGARNMNLQLGKNLTSNQE